MVPKNKNDIVIVKGKKKKYTKWSFV